MIVNILWWFAGGGVRLAGAVQSPALKGLLDYTVL